MKRGTTYKHISCLLLLGIYLCFLCFQVRYNLEVGRNSQRDFQRHTAANLAQKEPRTVSYAHHIIISKVKLAPSKRFHPNIANIEPPAVTAAVVFYPRQPYSDYHTPYFAHKDFYEASPLRGPPAA